MALNKKSHSPRIVVTGIGALCSLGTGVDEIFKNLKLGKVNIVARDSYSFGKYRKKFPVYKIPSFDITSFGINRSLLDEMRDWQEGEEVADLYYMMAAIQLALDDSKLKVDGMHDSGLVLTHENPGLENFCSLVFKSC